MKDYLYLPLKGRNLNIVLCCRLDGSPVESPLHQPVMEDYRWPKPPPSMPARLVDWTQTHAIAIYECRSG